MAEYVISLEKMRFFGRHGVFEHERRNGNEFEVNLNVFYPGDTFARPVVEEEEIPNLTHSDELEDTISYVMLFDIVKEEMDKPRNLIETVAQSIAERIKADYPFCSKIECKITKIKPPIPGFTGTASATYII